MTMVTACSSVQPWLWGLSPTKEAWVGASWLPGEGPPALSPVLLVRMLVLGFGSASPFLTPLFLCP